MRHFRYGLPLVAAVLVFGGGPGCTSRRYQGGGGPGAEEGGEHDGRFHRLAKRPPILLAPADAKHRQGALATFKKEDLGLLHDSEKGREADRVAALTTLRETIAGMPAALERTFGKEAATKLWSDVEVREPKPPCERNACLVDVYFRNWEAFDGLNQFLALDHELPWNRYLGTRYRSARERDRESGRFVVTWALVFPLKPIDSELAELPDPPLPRKAGEIR